MNKVMKQVLILVAGIIVLILILVGLFLVGYQPTDFIYQDF